MGCLLGLLAPAQAWSWGDEGHEIVGWVAAHFLNPAVRDKVNALLASDDSGLTADTGIASESTWADRYRDTDRKTGHTRNSESRYSRSRNSESRNSPSRNSQSRYSQTREWHYVDIEIDAPDLPSACHDFPALPPDTAASQGDPRDCIIDKIGQFRAELANPRTALPERLMALQFLLHFIGDLHQPLHAADAHDHGGNQVRVALPGFRPGNLHQYWDTVFVERLGMNSATVAASLIGDITPAQRREWAAGSPTDWAMQANALAKAVAYGELPPAHDGMHELSAGYADDATATVRLQLERAGVRLAAVLNAAL
jgi:hypothetical protein